MVANQRVELTGNLLAFSILSLVAGSSPLTLAGREKMKTYFSGEYSSRRPVTIVTGSFAALIGLALATIWVPQMFKEGLDHVIGTVCAMLFIISFLCFGAFLLNKALKNERTQLSITSNGISYGKKYFKWDDVEVIGFMQKYVGRRDLFCVVRSSSYQVEMPISKGLTDEDIIDLRGMLEADIVTNHPHIQIQE